MTKVVCSGYLTKSPTSGGRGRWKERWMELVDCRDDDPSLLKLEYFSSERKRKSPIGVVALDSCVGMREMVGGRNNSQFTSAVSLLFTDRSDLILAHSSRRNIHRWMKALTERGIPILLSVAGYNTITRSHSESDISSASSTTTKGSPKMVSKQDSVGSPKIESKQAGEVAASSPKVESKQAGKAKASSPKIDSEQTGTVTSSSPKMQAVKSAARRLPASPPLPYKHQHKKPLARAPVSMNPYAAVVDDPKDESSHIIDGHYYSRANFDLDMSPSEISDALRPGKKKGKIKDVKKRSESLNDPGIMLEKTPSLLVEPSPNLVALKSQIFASRQLQVISSNKIRIDEKLCEGRFGCVSQGSMEGLSVAVKELESSYSEQGELAFFKEAFIISQFKHSNIVQVLAVSFTESKLMILELLSKLTLKGHLALRYQRGKLDVEEMLKYCIDVAQGMKHIHTMGYIHKRLKARHVLVSPDGGNCKIAGFSESSNIIAESPISTEGVLSTESDEKWMAIEVLRKHQLSYQSDVWRYGVLLFEIWSVGKAPYDGFTYKKLFELLHAFRCSPPPPGCPKAIYQLMLQCWDHKPSKRPSWGTILEALQRKDRKQLLKVGGDAVESKRLPPQSLKLGTTDLASASTLYQDLQSEYTDLQKQRLAELQEKLKGAIKPHTVAARKQHNAIVRRYLDFQTLKSLFAEQQPINSPQQGLKSTTMNTKNTTDDIGIKRELRHLKAKSVDFNSSMDMSGGYESVPAVDLSLLSGDARRSEELSKLYESVPPCSFNLNDGVVEVKVESDQTDQSDTLYECAPSMSLSFHAGSLTNSDSLDMYESVPEVHFELSMSGKESGSGTDSSGSSSPSPRLEELSTSELSSSKSCVSLSKSVSDGRKKMQKSFSLSSEVHNKTAHTSTLVSQRVHQYESKQHLPERPRSSYASDSLSPASQEHAKLVKAYSADDRSCPIPKQLSLDIGGGSEISSLRSKSNSFNDSGNYTAPHTPVSGIPLSPRSALPNSSKFQGKNQPLSTAANRHP